MLVDKYSEMLYLEKQKLITETDRQTNRQTDRQTDRQADRQADK